MTVAPAPTHMPAPPLRHPLWVLLAVCALALLSTAGVALPYPILAPIFIDGPADAFTRFAGWPPEVLMGLALAVNPLGILLGSLVLGPLSDRVGRRPVLLASLLFGALCYGLSALALAWRNYPLFVLARLATGLTEGHVAVARALLADLHPALERTRSFAWLNASLYIGWLVGPLLGGLTLPLGEPVPFVLAATAMLPCLLVLLWGVPKAPSPPHPTTGLWTAMRDQQPLGLLRQDPQLARLFGLQLAFTFGVNALYEFEPLWMLQRAGLDSAGIAWVVAVQCLAMTAASLLAGRAGRPKRPLRRAAGLAASVSAGLLALSVLPAWPGLATIVLLGVPLAIYNAVLPAWISERFADHGQGRVMGLLSTVFCLANVLVALSGGLLALLDVGWIMAAGAAACVASVPALLRWDHAEAIRVNPAAPAAKSG